ncbi:hypothetical protein ACP4OV_028450 [Aristida adscensionis]
MEPRSGRRRRRRPCGGSDGVDRISGLPDDLLLHILARLRCARAAVRAGALSRRWLGLWRRLPELYFRNMAPADLEATLAQVALPKLSLLHIDDDFHGRADFSAAVVASLLRTAARLDPVDFSLTAFMYRDWNIAVEMPCFVRAKSIALYVWNLSLEPPPPGGEFPVLERLSITRCQFDPIALISRCPRLRALKMHECFGPETIMLRSATIEELDVHERCVKFVRIIDINAPALKKFTFDSPLYPDFNISLSAPMVESLSWECAFGYGELAVAIDGMWCLRKVKLCTGESSRVLQLHIRRAVFDEAQAYQRNLQGMFPFPNFSALELYLETQGHVYGATVFNLLRIYNVIHKLKIVIGHRKNTDQACLPNCDCAQPQNWRSQNISLMVLEEVEIENFRGGDCEVDFLKLVFRCASLKKVMMKLDSKPNRRGCKATYNIFKANPSVKSYVFEKCVKRNRVALAPVADVAVADHGMLLICAGVIFPTRSN